LDKSSQAWQIVENHLEGNKYLAGDEFSIGDIPLGVWAHRWFNLPIERPKQKNLTAWYERLIQRKPYQTHIMIPVT
jgi:glutathione S-transferase